MRLLNGSESIQNLDLDIWHPVSQASCTDPYLLVQTKEGQMVLLTLEKDIGMPQLRALNVNLKKSSKIVYVSVYKDTSGMFTSEVVRIST